MKEFIVTESTPLSQISNKLKQKKHTTNTNSRKAPTDLITFRNIFFIQTSYENKDLVRHAFISYRISQTLFFNKHYKTL
jgi:hypothetical protein